MHRSESNWTNEQMMIAAARKMAAQIGANGILMPKVQEPSAGAKVAAALLGVGTTRRGEIVAIFYRDTARTDAAAAPADLP